MPSKDYALKAPDVQLVPIPKGAATAVLSSPQTFEFNMQGHTGVVVQLNYTYGAATGLTFSFTEYDPAPGSLFPSPGSVVTKTDTSAGTATAYTISYAYPSLASGSVRLVFPISGDQIRMTITGNGVPTGVDAITAMVAIPCVLV